MKPEKFQTFHNRFILRQMSRPQLIYQHLGSESDDFYVGTLSCIEKSS